MFLHPMAMMRHLPVKDEANLHSSIFHHYSDEEIKKDVDDIDKDDDDEDDDDAEAQKRADKKAERDKKLLDDEENDKLISSINEKTDPGDLVEKPSKGNVFQRVQNAALDNHVKFKRKLANVKRDTTDAKNAGKAVAKIPLDIKRSIDKQVDEWDEWDDDRRKKYILQPGVRKKYFRALKICLLHYGAFAINPVLNIVLLICQSFSRTKDVRIRNEFRRELNAEIEICERKIEDAASKGDDKKKYKLMRIKAKLEAERDRISTNSAVI